MRGRRLLLSDKIVAVVAGACVMAACSDVTTSPVSGNDLSANSAKGGPVRDTPVRSELGTDGLSIQSDGATYVNGVNGVVSILQGQLGDWELDLSGKSSTRRTRVDLSDPVAGNTSPPPFGNELVSGRFIAKGAQELVGSFAGMVGEGSTFRTPLSLSFAYGGKQYGLRMNPANHPATEWALVTCTGVDAANGCNTWRITPTGSHGAVSKNIARLEQVNNKGTSLVGHYYISFDIALTK